MKRIWGPIVRLVGAGLVVGAIVVGAIVPACTTNDQSIFIHGALAPSTNRQNGTCIYTNDPTQAELFEGTLDIGLRDNFGAILLVGNQLVARGDPLSNRAESNRVHINGAVVTVTRPDGTEINSFTASGVGFADPQNNNTPGYGTVNVTLLDKPTAAMAAASLSQTRPNNMATRVIAHVKVFGTSLGGVNLESGEFTLPIDVCYGCLVDFSAADDPDAGTQPNCRNPPATGSSGTTTLPCVVGQDESIPCQNCLAAKVCNP
ncbi:MAG: hypothetical protein FWD69_03370 [Polyangiaceae bacterium]|nr:hypothetical protein [Polyangiaceae bacterium]